MAVVDARDQLLEEIPRLVLGEPACLDDAVKELPPRRVLHGYAQVRRGEEDLWERREGGNEGTSGRQVVRQAVRYHSVRGWVSDW